MARHKFIGSFAGIFAALPVILILGLFVWFLVAMFGPKAEEQPSPFEASLLTHTTLDPATSNVEISVTNTDTVSHSPECSIYVESVNGNYHGSNSVRGADIAPGATVKYSKNITVTKEGAAYITGGEVSCDIAK